MNVEEFDLQVDASSLAAGVSLQMNGSAFVELDTTIKGVNLAIQWEVKNLH